MEKQLEGLRKKIDKVDSQILGLLKKRLDLVANVGMIKKKNKVKPLDRKRWQMVLKKLSENAKKQGISNVLIRKIWNLIHEEALKIEKKI